MPPGKGPSILDIDSSGGVLFETQTKWLAHRT